MRNSIKVLFALFFVVSFCIPVLAEDLDSITAPLATDYTQAAQLPLTGWFTKTLPEGRTMKLYISPEASIRTYFTVIAIPDGEDTREFLDAEGWIDLMDTLGEALIALEPGAKGWGSPESESGYINAAMGVVRSGRNGNNIPVLSSFGEFYLVGYREGAAPLEVWAAANPILVISQVYIGGKSDIKAMAAAGSAPYDGRNTSGYDPGIADPEEFKALLRRTGLSPIARKDVPVPTWLIDHAGSGEYWRYANDCYDEEEEGTYWQRSDSRRAQTLYANSKITGKNGISQVKVSQEEEPDAQELYEWLSVYTRYDVTFAYSNALAYRLNYTEARVDAQQKAKDGKILRTYETKDYKGSPQKVDILAQSDIDIEDHGTVQVGIFAFNGSNPREYIVYIPQDYDNDKLPVLFVYPGNTQTDSIFFDCTQWYQAADREGIALVFVCETYSSPVSVTHLDPYYYHTAMLEILRRDINGKLADLDFTRIYGTGQSMGSMTTQDMARVKPEFFAAVGSTSGVPEAATNGLPFGDDPSSDKPIPTMMLTGQSDLPLLLPDLNAPVLTRWANYFLKVNGLNRTVGTKDMNYGADDYSLLGRRTEVFTWKTRTGIPVFSWGQTLVRPHNCYPSEMPILWEFMKHYSVGEDGTRYYSPSGFTREDDTVKIF